MTTIDYSTFTNNSFIASLSSERFERYFSWANNDRAKALELYALNTTLSESFYTSLQILEITIRNGFHGTLSQCYGDDWFDSDGFLKNVRQIDQVHKARAELQSSNKPETSGRIVAELTFGFWTAMVGKHYEDLWQKDLHRVALSHDGKRLTRKQFTQPLHPIRELRNRIAHHEPILHWNLPKHYKNIVQIITWINQDAAQWCEHHSRFLAIYPAQGIKLVTDKEKQ